MRDEGGLYLPLTKAGYTVGMNIDIDQGRWAAAGDDANRSRPDWHVLRARLGVIHAAHGAMAGEEPSGPAGSFEAGCAAALAGFGSGLASVNPDALVNGKRANRKDTAAAGAQLSGSRG